MPVFILRTSAPECLFHGYTSWLFAAPVLVQCLAVRAITRASEFLASL